MKPVRQTLFSPIKGDPESTGNCFAACVASILELPLEEVPNFCALDTWFKDFEKWLNDRGLTRLYIQYPTKETLRWSTGKSHYISTGKSPRGDWLHCTVWCNNEMVHDPHPDDTGIEDCHDVIFIGGITH